MNKMNKKGFTLIEMLVVIAIIAVLVSIIIPTVTSATGKAKAATDAANLRSMLAEATTDYLNGQSDDTGLVKLVVGSDASGNKTYTFSARPGAPACESVEGAELNITVNNGILKGAYGNYSLDAFAKVAEAGGELVADMNQNQNPNPDQSTPDQSTPA